MLFWWPWIRKCRILPGTGSCHESKCSGQSFFETKHVRPPARRPVPLCKIQQCDCVHSEEKGQCVSCKATMSICCFSSQTWKASQVSEDRPPAFQQKQVKRCLNRCRCPFKFWGSLMGVKTGSCWTPKWAALTKHPRYHVYPCWLALLQALRKLLLATCLHVCFVWYGSKTLWSSCSWSFVRLVESTPS